MTSLMYAAAESCPTDSWPNAVVVIVCALAIVAITWLVTR